MTTLVVGAAAIVGLIAVSQDGQSAAIPALAANKAASGSAIVLPPAGDSSVGDSSAGGSAALTDPTPSTVTGATILGATTDPAQDLAGDDPATSKSCQITEQSVRQGSTGPSVSCLQQALLDAGYYTGSATGEFDQATYSAARKMQTDRDLFVDGIVGRESAISLGIWHDEALAVVHTPIPPKGAKDLLGYPLSTVATSGPDAPPLPPNSGTGKRLVYDRAALRVWAVDKNEQVIRSWLVAGSKYSNETPGTHAVYSKSQTTTAWNGKAYLNKMVRWLKTDIGAIGFHAIPIHVADGTVYQTEAELGQRLSGGCQRQANLDADFTWDFADIGTPVIVI